MKSTNPARGYLLYIRKSLSVCLCDRDVRCFFVLPDNGRAKRATTASEASGRERVLLEPGQRRAALLVYYIFERVWVSVCGPRCPLFFCVTRQRASEASNPPRAKREYFDTGYNLEPGQRRAPLLVNNKTRTE